MDLSIIIPVYNTDINLVKRCIQSVINTKDIKYEILFINDGSKKEFTTQYISFINSYDKKSIKYIEKENGGVSSARNLGIEKSKGKYITFLDSDDIVYSESFCIDYFKTDYDIILFNKEYFGKHTHGVRRELLSDEGEVDYKTVLEEFVERDRFHHPGAKLIKTEFLKNNNILFDKNLIQGEDAIFNLEMLLKKPKIYYTNKKGYGYFYDFNTSINRWKKFPQKMFDNFVFIYQKKLSSIKYLDQKKHDYLIEKASANSINYLFQFCTDFINSKFDRYYLVNSKKYIKVIKKTKLDLKSKIQFTIIDRGYWGILKIIAKIRQLYLKYLKFKWN